MKSRLLLLLAWMGTLSQSFSQTYFVNNDGQWQDDILLKSEFQGGSLYLEDGTFNFNLYDTEQLYDLIHNHHQEHDTYIQKPEKVKGHCVKMNFIGANPFQDITKTNPLPEYFNYYIGNQPEKWASYVKAHQNIRINNIYQGIDLNIQCTQSSYKYDFIVAPNSDASQLQIAYQGANSLQIIDEELVINTSIHQMVEQKPYCYQVINGKKISVEAIYLLNGNQLSFEFPKGYNKNYELVIDPEIVFSRYSSSFANNFGYTATYDSYGNAFGAGSVFAQGYITTPGAYDIDFNGASTDVGISKYTTDGLNRIYATYLGGSNTELPHSIIVNSRDELYIFGTTSSPDFPIDTFLTAIDTSYNGGTSAFYNGLGVTYTNGSDIFVARLSEDGTALLSSTLIGGSANDGLNDSPFTTFNYADQVRGEIEIDEEDNVFIATCTASDDFPIVDGVQDTSGGGLDAIVVKMDENLSTILWSTYLGGTDDDAAYSLAIDTNKNIIIAGGTHSIDFPTANALEPMYQGGQADGFIARLHSTGTGLLQSTFHGTPEYDQIYFVDLNKDNEVHIFGQTNGAAGLLIQNAIYNQLQGGQMITKFDEDISTIVWSTRFGDGQGIPDISPTAFLVDLCSQIFLSGWGSPGLGTGQISGTAGLDITPNALDNTTDNGDIYFMVLRDDASSLQYASFFGGEISREHVDGGTSRFDRKGVIYQAVCAGCQNNQDFPTVPADSIGTWNNNSGLCNLGLVKYDFLPPSIIADFNVPPYSCAPADLHFENTSSTAFNDTSQSLFIWSVNDSIIENYHLDYSFQESGTYTITLLAIDSMSCNFKDSLSQEITIIGNSSTLLDTAITCLGSPIQIGVNPIPNPSVSYQWTPTDFLSSTTISNPFANPPTDTTYTLIISYQNCVDTFLQPVKIESLTIDIQARDSICANDTVTLNAFPQSGVLYDWSPDNIIESGQGLSSAVFIPNQSTWIYANATDNNGCTTTDSIYINVITTLPDLEVTATPDTIHVGDTSQLLATSLDTDIFLWEIDTTLSNHTIENPLAYPTQTQDYYVQIHDGICPRRDTVTVHVIYPDCIEGTLYVPNAFTPNNDGNNDNFYVRSSLPIDGFYFAVYDRWGQKVFETRDINEGWDGTFKGIDLSPTAFGWYAEGICPNGNDFFIKGNVTLIR